MAAQDLASAKKNAALQRRTFVFVDESGLSTKPTRARTWAPRGHTPVHHESFSWKSLSIIGRLTRRRFYFQIHPGSIKSPQVIEFIKHLRRHIKGRILIIWDGVAIHRSALVRDYLATTKGKAIAERLPP